MAQPQERKKEEEEQLRMIRSQIPTRDQQQLLLTSQRSAILLIVALSSLVGIALFLMSSSSSFEILHQVPDGHVGVYWRGGALMETFTHPEGFHLKLPSTRFRPIQVIIRFDAVRDVPCTTMDGVNITFDKIEVVSRLPKEHVYKILLEHGVDYDKTLMLDRVHPKIKEICSVHRVEELYLNRLDFVGEEMGVDFRAHCLRYAPGIQIRDVRVYQTIIPDSIKRAYNRLEEKRTKALVAAEMQKMDPFQERITEVRMYVEAECGANCTEKARMYLEAEGDDNCTESEEIEKYEDI